MKKRIKSALVWALIYAAAPLWAARVLHLCFRNGWRRARHQRALRNLGRAYGLG